jgi:hypothetical protein
MSADGKVIFHSRETVMDGHGTTAAIFDEVDPHLRYSNLELSNDDADLYTQVIVTNTGGSAQSVEDADAVTRYGPRTLAKSGLKLVSDDDALGQAGALLVRYRTPAGRIVSVTCPPKSYVNWAMVLGLDTHHPKVSVRRDPPGTGTIDLFAHVEGISWEISGPTWVPTFALVPAFEEQFWQWDINSEFDEADNALGW